MASVVVSVGTDKHPFDRLVGWADSWARDHPDVDVFIQHGNSSAPVNARGAALIPHADLLDMIRNAVVAISHGGPSTVMDVRASNRMPIVLGRDPELGEHVDGHQMRFAEHLSKHGMAILVESEVQLHQMIDDGLANPASLSLGDGPSDVPEGIRAFGQHLDGLLGIDRG